MPVVAGDTHDAAAAAAEALATEDLTVAQLEAWAETLSCPYRVKLQRNTIVITDVAAIKAVLEQPGAFVPADHIGLGASRLKAVLPALHHAAAAFANKCVLQAAHATGDTPDAISVTHDAGTYGLATALVAAFGWRLKPSIADRLSTSLAVLLQPGTVQQQQRQQRQQRRRWWQLLRLRGGGGGGARDTARQAREFVARTLLAAADELLPAAALNGGWHASDDASGYDHAVSSVQHPCADSEDEAGSDDERHSDDGSGSSSSSSSSSAQHMLAARGDSASCLLEEQQRRLCRAVKHLECETAAAATPPAVVAAAADAVAPAAVAAAVAAAQQLQTEDDLSAAATQLTDALMAVLALGWWTAGGALAWVLYDLAAHPEAQQRLAGALRDPRAAAVVPSAVTPPLEVRPRATAAAAAARSRGGGEAPDAQQMQPSAAAATAAAAAAGRAAQRSSRRGGGGSEGGPREAPDAAVLATAASAAAAEAARHVLASSNHGDIRFSIQTSLVVTHEYGRSTSQETCQPPLEAALAPSPSVPQTPPYPLLEHERETARDQGKWGAESAREGGGSSGSSNSRSTGGALQLAPSHTVHSARKRREVPAAAAAAAADAADAAAARDTQAGHAQGNAESSGANNAAAQATPRAKTKGSNGASSSDGARGISGDDAQLTSGNAGPTKVSGSGNGGTSRVGVDGSSSTASLAATNRGLTRSGTTAGSGGGNSSCSGERAAALLSLPPAHRSAQAAPPPPRTLVSDSIVHDAVTVRATAVISAEGTGGGGGGGAGGVRVTTEHSGSGSSGGGGASAPPGPDALLWQQATAPLTRAYVTPHFAVQVSGGVPYPDAAVSGGVPYLSAVVQESLRLHAPGGGAIALSAATADAAVGHVSAPRGTDVVLLTGAAARSEENFTKAAEFLPERWLAAAEQPPRRARQRRQRHRGDASMPFGHGAAACAWQVLAELQLKASVEPQSVEVAVATLLQRFSISLAEWQDEPVPTAGSSYGPPPVRLVFTERGANDGAGTDEDSTE
ncbi:hypothetical protein JKP88DRAFT_283777 [Tribonema minus]|uniref:Cytochrome P450 n=1 Tax=Tribonema minus TaxID=303371 RepID=A0A835YQE0_9STRA|nr:hypothetical protein JKP88DRAFT_283777 [Tribonema minus]